MVSAEAFRDMALALPGASAAPHVDRIAFRARLIFATLAPDGLSANLKLTAEHQEFKCLMAPDAFRPVSGGWGRMGWTTVELAAVEEAELAEVLAFAHALAAAKPARRGKT